MAPSCFLGGGFEYFLFCCRTLQLVVRLGECGIFFIFTLNPWGHDPIWRAYFWKGLFNHQPVFFMYPAFMIVYASSKMAGFYHLTTATTCRCYPTWSPNILVCFEKLKADWDVCLWDISINLKSVHLDQCQFYLHVCFLKDVWTSWIFPREYGRDQDEWSQTLKMPSRMVLYIHIYYIYNILGVSPTH